MAKNVNEKIFSTVGITSIIISIIVVITFSLFVANADKEAGLFLFIGFLFIGALFLIVSNILLIKKNKQLKKKIPITMAEVDKYLDKMVQEPDDAE